VAAPAHLIGACWDWSPSSTSSLPSSSSSTSSASGAPPSTSWSSSAAGDDCARPVGEGFIARFAMARLSKRRRENVPAGGSAPSKTRQHPPGGVDAVRYAPSASRCRGLVAEPWAWGSGITVVVVAVVVVFVVLDCNRRPRAAAPRRARISSPCLCPCRGHGVSPSVSSTIGQVGGRPIEPITGSPAALTGAGASPSSFTSVPSSAPTAPPSAGAW